MIKAPKILYFLKGAVPAANEDKIAYRDYGPNVYFRNGSLISPDEALEPCDGVAGFVPESYKQCPSGDVAMKNYNKSVNDAAKALEQPEPVVTAPAAPSVPPAPVPPAPPAAPVADAGWGTPAVTTEV